MAFIAIAPTLTPTCILKFNKQFYPQKKTNLYFMAKKAVITPAQYLKERYEMSDTSPAALMKAYTTLKNIPDSEVFNHLAEYWSNQASHSGSIVLMVQMWYYGKAHRYGDRRFI